MLHFKAFKTCAKSWREKKWKHSMLSSMENYKSHDLFIVEHWFNLFVLICNLLVIIQSSELMCIQCSHSFPPPMQMVNALLSLSLPRVSMSDSNNDSFIQNHNLKIYKIGNFFFGMPFYMNKKSKHGISLQLVALYHP